MGSQPIALMDLKKSVNNSVVVVGETVTFEVVALNNGSFIIGNIPNEPVYIYDVLRPELEFVKGSVKVNGIPNPIFDINAGIDIGILNINESKSITFDAKIIQYNPNIITNTANGTYGYVLLGGKPQKGMSISNIVELSIYKANIDVIKKSDKDFVVLGDIITYTVQLVNNGTVDASNVIFTDILPVGTGLVDESFKVNNIVVNNVNLEKGVNVGTIKAGTTTTVVYKVKVLLPTCSLQLENKSQVKFSYRLPDGTTGKGKSEVTENSSSLINLGITNFKQMSIEEYLHIPPQKPDIEQINNINGTIDIIKYHVIETSRVKSTEGQTLSGYKLVIHGVLREIVEYTACEEAQSVHSAHYDIPFSTFIVLPENYIVGSKVEVNSIVEDIYHRDMDCRIFFTNATVLINAKILTC